MEVEGAMGNGALEATAPADEASFAIPPPQPSEQNGGAEKMDTDSFAATLPAGGYSTVGAAEEGNSPFFHLEASKGLHSEVQLCCG